LGYTSPTTAVAGQVYNSARYNAETKDNLNWLVQDSPRCSAIRSSVLSVADNTSTAITLPDTEEYDPLGMHPTGAGSDLITIPTGGDGLYVAHAMLGWSNASTVGRRLLVLQKNGADIPSCGDGRPADPGGTTHQNISVEIRLVAADTLGMKGLQTSGAALNVNAARLQVRWVGV
jgi:hypothetical protein